MTFKHSCQQKLCPVCLRPYTERKLVPVGRYRHWEDGKVRWCKVDGSPEHKTKEMR